MDGLPTPLPALCAGHPEMAVAALSVLAGAAGPSVAVCSTTSQTYPCTNILLLIEMDGCQPDWLDCLLEPVAAYQRHLLASAPRNGEVKALLAKEAEVKAQRDQFLANDRFPDREHVDYFAQQLRRIIFQQKRLCFVGRPAPGSLSELFTQSPDESLFLTWSNPQLLLDSVYYKRDYELLARALNGEVCMQRHDDGDNELQQPHMSGIAVCDVPCLKTLLTSYADLFLKPGRVLIVSASGQTGKAVSPNTAAVDWWRRLVNRIFEDRFQQMPRFYSLSVGAESALQAAQGREFLQLWKKSAFPVQASTELCVRLMLLLHLCQDNPAEAIAEATASTAIKLACWLVVENQRALATYRAVGLAEKRKADCAAMLEKISEKGPIKQRDLWRCYTVQSQSAHKPILDTLLQSGAVVKDAEGMLRVSVKEEMTVKPPSCAIPDFHADKH